MKVTRTAFISIVLALCALPISAADHVVTISNFSFSPNVLTIQAGDTVIWQNVQGHHDVVADDSSFSSGPPAMAPWTYSRSFATAGEFRYFCSPHGGPNGQGMSGRIIVQGQPPAFRINEGLNGIWHNPATSGQGWFFDFSPTLDYLFAAWFTWSLERGEHDWFTAEGAYNTDSDRVTVPLVRTRGGRFDANDPVTRELAGQAEFIFQSCTRAVLRYRVDEHSAQREIPLERILPAPASCQAAQGD